MDKSSYGKGVFFAASAYVMWGFFPFYWKMLSAIHSVHILGFRIIFSLLLVGLILFAGKNTSWLRFYKDRRRGILMILAALLISFNWGLYILAVNSGHTIETAIGYYINPLLSIVLGLCFFKEKLKLLQIVAFGLAFAGVLILTILTGSPPWISLALAFSFAIYGLIKKSVSMSALESLGVETLIAFPLGVLLLITTFEPKINFPDPQSLSYVLVLPPKTLFLLFLCGAVTSLPLYFFAKSTKILPLSTIGFVQFLSPTLAFLTGFFIFGESFPPQNFIALGCIWVAVILYIISLSRENNKKSLPK